MDNALGNTYLPEMFPSLVAFLAVLAIAVFSTAASSHAVQIGAAHDHAMHGGAVMQTEDADAPSCTEERCGPVAAGICDVVCAALHASLPSRTDIAGQEFGPSPFAIPDGAILSSHSGRPNERPPRLRLL